MFTLFEGRTADEIWQRIAERFRSGRDVELRPSRAGLTHEIARTGVTLEDPRQRWITSRVPAINPAFALAEVVWIIRGRHDSEFVSYFNRALPRFAGEGPTFHGAYGFRLRRHFGIDQLERAYAVFAKNPDTRQVVLQLWDGRVDLPDAAGREVAPDIPCNVVAIVKVRNGVLDWLQVLRSNDAFRGLPYNIVQFSTLHEVLAGWLGIAAGSYNQISDSLHVYDDCLESVTSSIAAPACHNTDSMSWPRNESEKYFRELEMAVERLIDERVEPGDVLALVEGSDLPVAFRNMLCVLAAEAVRRRRRPELIDTIMEMCANPCYRVLVRRWVARTSSRPVRNQAVDGGTRLADGR